MTGRTGVEAVRVWHAGVLLEARKRTEIDRPLAQLHDLALQRHTGGNGAREKEDTAGVSTEVLG